MKIILYILDSLRNDHLSCYGYHRKTSPNIDGLAEEGVLFENAFAPSTWTRPSAASILTGCYPLTHGVETMSSYLASQIPKLPAVLKENGYACAAFSTIAQFSKEFGFSDGFDQFFELFRNGRSLNGSSHNETIFPSSGDINEVLFQWIQEHAARDFVAVIWSMDTHVPYTIPLNEALFLGEGKKQREINIDYKATTFTREELEAVIDLYDSAIYYNDQNIGILRNLLEKMGIYDDTLIIICGDHGEIFNEHVDPKTKIGSAMSLIKRAMKLQKRKCPEFYGRRGHGDVPPYDVATKIPLIVKFPNNRSAGKRVNNLVSLIDLAPTIAHLTDMEDEGNHINYDGRNLMDLLQDNTLTPTDERVYLSGRIYPHSPSFYGIRSHKWKYIISEPSIFSLRQLLKEKKKYLMRYFKQKYYFTNKILYDIRNDAETVNVINDAPLIAKEMNRQLQEWRNECARKGEKLLKHGKQSHEISEAYKKQLRELGYF
jgi:arylsulfatase A-like enzyme